MSKPTDSAKTPAIQLTTGAGNPIADNQNSLGAGPREPLLLQDYQLIEKLAHQNRERIPERPVHAKGWGAYGTLTITGDISRLTKARALQPGTKTPLALRFSTVAGERDVRDPYKFPDFIHTQKRHPKTHLRSPTAMWDFWSLSPESLHQVTILMSDRGLPTSVRHVNGYGSHTYSLINTAGERVWVKFHFKTQQGHKHWTNAQAAEVVGRTRESIQEDLFEAIDKGDLPTWKMQVPIMTDAQAHAWSERTGWNPFNLTKVWPHGDAPVIDVGIVELNRNPDNYFAEIEQAAFAPSNLVPGIGFSPDRMLQARVFSYADAHRYRLGTHYEALPVNTPRCPVHHYHQDGPMRFFDNNTKNPDAYYEPKSFNGPKEDKRFAEPALPLHGDANRCSHRDGNDDYTQTGNLFRLFDAGQRQRLFSNIAAAGTSATNKPKANVTAT